jgi:hypothetical protein
LGTFQRRSFQGELNIRLGPMILSLGAAATVCQVTPWRRGAAAKTAGLAQGLLQARNI